MKNRKNKFYLLFALCFVIVLGIIIIPGLKKNYKDVKSNKYSTVQIEGFEKNIFGSTGWAVIDLPLKESASEGSNKVTDVSAGTPFMILGVNDSYFEIKYGNYHGYVDNRYCMINLPDVVPSIVYNITNSYSSIYKSSGAVIDGVTGETLYGVNCNNNLCQEIGTDGKVVNNKIGRSEYIAPILYSAALKIAQAQTLAVNDGYSLMIYDSYRPRSVSTYIAQKLSDLYSRDSIVKNGIDFSTGESGTQYNWGQGWFLAQGLSTHNVGSAIDVTLYKLSNNSEVIMPTAMHELSTAAIKYYSPEAPKDSTGYSTGMKNNEDARRLDNYMTSVGMGTLASEWWHFQDNDGYSLLSNATNLNGADFQVTSILSDYGFSNNLTAPGDVNGDGNINDADAELVYKFYKFFESNVCDGCNDLKNYSDVNGNNSIDLDDVYLILSTFESDLITSSSYTIGNDYIDVGTGTFDEAKVSLSDIQNLSLDVDNVNNKVLIKYHGDVIKEYDIVSYSYDGKDLSKDYIFASPSEVSAAKASGKFSCTNCSIIFDQVYNKVYIKKDINSNQNLREFDLIYMTTGYNMEGSYIDVNTESIQEFLSGISIVNCDICESYIKDGDNIKDTGSFIGGEKLVIIKDSKTLKQYDLVFRTKDVVISKNSLNLELDQEKSFNLSADIRPSYSTNKNVTWESSNPSVATVDQNGLVTAVGVGSATITVTTEDGEFYDDCSVNVSEYFTWQVVYRNNGSVYTQNYRAGENVIVDDIESNMEGYRIVGWRYNNQDYSLTDSLPMPRMQIELEAIYEPIPSITDYTIEESNGIKYIKDIPFKTNVSGFNLNLGSGMTFKIYDGDSVKATGNVATGNIIKIYSGNELVDEYQVVIKGDVNGDGEVKIGDAVKIYKNLYNNFFGVSECIRKAADYNGDGEVKIGDFVKIYKDLFNS